MWEGVPLDSVKFEWQEKLRGMSSKVVFKAVDYCSSNLKFPPSLPEFILLCKANTPSEITLALPRHFTTDEIAKNHERMEKAIKNLDVTARTDYKGWAKNIIANPKNYPDISLKFAQEALAS